MPIYIEFLNLGVDLLKQLAWPIAAVIIAFLFRGEFRTLLPKLRRVGPTGLEFEVERQRAAPVVAPGQLKELPGISRTQAMAHIERLLHDSLHQSTTKQEDREDLLVRLLAQSRLETLFEQTYRLIFGSQISALKLLNQGIRASDADARAHFEHQKELNPEVYEHYGYEQWLGFLLGRDLIMQSKDTFEITDIGRDFLLYLTAKGLSENKPF